MEYSMITKKIQQFVHTIRFKLILIFIILFLIPFLLVETIIYRTIERQALENTNEQMINSLKITSDYTSTLLSNIQIDFQNIIYQEDFILALLDIRNLGNITTARQLAATEQLVDDLEPFLENRRIHSVYLYNLNNHVFYDFAYLSPSYTTATIESSPWYNAYSQLFEDNEPVYNNNVWALTESIGNIGTPDTTAIISNYIRFQSASGHTTILSVNISSSELEDVMASLVLPEGAILTISDRQDRIIAATDSSYKGQSLQTLYGGLPDNNEVRTLKGSKRHFSTYTSNLLGYDYVIDMPYSYIIATARESRTLLYGLYFAIIIIMITMNVVIQRFLLRPINAMIAKMRHVEKGDFDITLPDNRKDELGILYRNFNTMTRNIHQLIEKNYVEELQRKQSDLNYIQTQLNEHFLYNTLDAIYSLIMIEDQDKAQEMLLSLSRFFRTTLNNGKQVITLQEIVAMLHSYCHIMALRNPDKYSVVFDVDEALYETYALKFLFQPLIENAFIHGINDRKQGGAIHISIQQEGQNLVYTVRDNGKGIDDLTLKKLNKMFGETTAQTQNDYFALNNIATQARLFYRDEFNIHIKSQLYKYTECKVTLPLLTSPTERAVTYDQSNTGR